MTRTTRLSLIALLAWLSLCFLVATFGALVTNPGEWYAELAKPPWTPPNWAFGPVWTALYTLMGIAAWMVWERRHYQGARPALGLFLAQLVCNGLWSWLFFSQHMTFVALVDILLLTVLILGTIITFHRIRPLAGWLLVPYLAWVLVAVSLNAGVIVLNA